MKNNLLLLTCFTVFVQINAREVTSFNPLHSMRPEPCRRAAVCLAGAGLNQLLSRTPGMRMTIFPMKNLSVAWGYKARLLMCRQMIKRNAYSSILKEPCWSQIYLLMGILQASTGEVTPLSHSRSPILWIWWKYHNHCWDR